MKSLLKQCYSSMRMDEICRVCCGKPVTYRCALCRKTRKDYKEADLLREVEEFEYLKETWNKCRIFKQLSTGIKRLDLVITHLFGAPHNCNWRNYDMAKNVNMDDFVVLRIARVA
jgi:hypothetical protein